MRAIEKPKILIVDDQPRNLDVLEVMLGDLDCQLVRATSPDEALLCLVRNDFAALVLDIRMPGMSGIELATLIKQRKRSQHVPIRFSPRTRSTKRTCCSATASARSIT
jgi:CheY-like chemotaxis protein